jgi:DNA adenine methylase
MYDPYPSPLRYPGGKTLLTQFLAETIRLNNLVGGTYVEPYAGGAGAALSLVFSEQVSRIFINDKDPGIFWFWKSVLEHTDEFTGLIDRSRVTVDAWKYHKSVLRHPSGHSGLHIGFATFFLNRCNRSGVLNGGPIGGLRQNGNYAIDVRFNRRQLIRKVQKIGLYRERITVSNLDGVTFLRRFAARETNDVRRCLVYMDPPYFGKACRLYTFYFKDADHERLAAYLKERPGYRWIVSYDDSAAIRKLFPGRKIVLLKSYSVHSARTGRELVIASPGCHLPRSYFASVAH